MDTKVVSLYWLLWTRCDEHGCAGISWGSWFHFLCIPRSAISIFYGDSRASLLAEKLKRLPAMRETWVLSLGWEDPLEKEMATHSNILAWRIPWTEPGELQSIGLQRVRHDWVTSLSLSLSFMEEDASHCCGNFFFKIYLTKKQLLIMP